MIEEGFAERRKTMSNALRRMGLDGAAAAEALRSCGIEPKARAEPLSYKVSWNFDMVLVSQNRDSVMIEDGVPGWMNRRRCRSPAPGGGPSAR